AASSSSSSSLVFSVPREQQLPSPSLGGRQSAVAAREIRFRCYDWDGAEGDHEFIGEFATTPKELFSNDGREVTFELINPRKAKRKRIYRNSGTVTAKTIPIDADFSFLDYMFSGTDLCFTVAIDMTASNGSPSQPTSLHYTDPFTPNQYTIAMQAVLEIIQDYDSDQLLPAFGFGCRAPPDYRVSHEWPLNGRSRVLEAYRHCLEEVRLSGPTHFAPVIKHVSRLALNHQDGSRYYVLLILTDGTIDDWTECKRAVIEASYLPVSIIVVGIGSGNFTEMELLDQDVWLLEEGGQKACRDIVQFVELRKYLRVAADGSDGRPLEQGGPGQGRTAGAAQPDPGVHASAKAEAKPASAAAIAEFVGCH
uniref:VWFA domain-containing protein n=1 Tax=Macrostomum lignano TaxID=282301 RepID=A0A1I8JRV2_9PLAT